MGLGKKVKKPELFQAILLGGVVLFFVLEFDLVVSVVSTLIRIVMPLVVGVVIAYVMDLIVRFFERHYFKDSRKLWVVKSRKSVSVLLALFVVVMVLVLVTTMVTPQVVSIFQVLQAELPSLYERSIVFVSEMFDSFFDIENLPGLPADFNEQFSNVISLMTSGVLNVAGSAIGSVFSFVISFVFALYLLLTKNTLLKQLDHVFSVYLPHRRKEKLYSVLNVTNDVFSRFFVGQAIEALILGVLCMVGMILLGFPYAAMVGTVVGLTALVPMVGALIGGAVGFIVIASQNVLQALGFTVFFIILQQIEGNLIYPKVVGASVGLPGVFVFGAVVIGGGLFGITGILFGVPIAATIYRLVKLDMERRINVEIEK